MIDLKKYRDFLLSKDAEKRYLENKRVVISKELFDLQQSLSDLTEAQDIMNAVGVLAQTEVKEVIESLVTKALQSIYGPEYSFEIENAVLRNQPETYFYVVINGVRNSLREELGGGVVDTVGFALRVILWALQNTRTDNVLILDEPFRNLSRNHIGQVKEMIKYLSEALGLQIIIVSHIEELGEEAGAVFCVEQINGTSFVKKVM